MRKWSLFFILIFSLLFTSCWILTEDAIDCYENLEGFQLGERRSSLAWDRPTQYKRYTDSNIFGLAEPPNIKYKFSNNSDSAWLFDGNYIPLKVCSYPKKLDS
jgi:hypothetical protein